MPNYAFKRTAGDTTSSTQALSARQPLNAALALTRMDLATLKTNIASREADDFVREFVLEAPCLHLDHSTIEHIRASLSEAVGITITPDEIVVVGSAKIGFGLFEKKVSVR